MDSVSGSLRASALGSDLRSAVNGLVDTIQHTGPVSWERIPGPRVWSIGKEAEHAADGLHYHKWIILRTIGRRVSPRRPAIERDQLTSNHSLDEVISLLRERVDECARLVESLTGAQLVLPTRPPRAKGELLAGTVERVMIGHVIIHRLEIESKLRLSQ